MEVGAGLAARAILSRMFVPTSVIARRIEAESSAYYETHKQQWGQYTKRRRSLNPSLRIEEYRKHRSANLAKAKVYYLANKAQIDNRQKSWALNNPEKKRASDREHYVKNGEKIRTHVRERHHLRAWGSGHADWRARQMLLQNGCCAFCDRPQEEFKRAFAIDHDHRFDQRDPRRVAPITLRSLQHAIRPCRREPGGAQKS